MNPRSFPEVLCPGCKTTMTVKRVLRNRPDTRRAETVVYHCARCDVETTRSFTVSEASMKRSAGD